jgi:hypothetical protein
VFAREGELANISTGKIEGSAETNILNLSIPLSSENERIKYVSTNEHTNK